MVYVTVSPPGFVTIFPFPSVTGSSVTTGPPVVGGTIIIVVSTSPRALVTALPFSSVTGIPTSFEI